MLGGVFYSNSEKLVCDRQAQNVRNLLYILLILRNLFYESYDVSLNEKWDFEKYEDDDCSEWKDENFENSRELESYDDDTEILLRFQRRTRRLSSSDTPF